MAYENGKRQQHIWDVQAEFYQRMAAMELEDTVIDSGGGPGKLPCQIA